MFKYKHWLLASLALSVLIVINISVTAAPSPRFCGACHQADLRAWAGSAHQNVSCRSCHQGPGVAGMAAQRLRIVEMLGNTVTGNRNAAAQVKSDTCLKCHDDIRRGTVRSNGLVMSHKEVIAARLPCAECHRKAVHGAGRRYGAAGMETCLKCHLEEGADISCKSCHTGNPARRKAKELTPWRVAHGPEVEKNHGLLDTQLCSVCHATQYCFRCHKVRDLPHSPGWLNLHGAVAKRTEKDCLSCHRKSACEKCHTVKMPHGNDWLKNHSSVAKKQGKDICLGCHMDRGCDECHQRHIHPVNLRRLEKNFPRQEQPGDRS